MKEQPIIRIGLGPRTTANSFTQSGVKVAWVLDGCEGFSAGCFSEKMTFEELSLYDVLVFIKIFPAYDVLKRLKDAGKILILDYQDMFLFPSVYERNPLKKLLKKVFYFSEEYTKRRLYKLFDRCLVSSPISEQIVEEAGTKPHFIIRQIYNDSNETNSKQHTKRTKNLKLIWTGVELNLKQNAEIEPVLEKLCRKYDSKVIYLTQANKPNTEFIEYQTWNIDTWENDLLQGDIAFRWWGLSNDQYHKDSNKVISYMAAGLPIVCKPTASDKQVIEHGVTGFMVETVDEFEKCVDELMCNYQLRRKMGENAHKEAWSKYSLKEHVKAIEDLINGLLKRGRNE